MFENSISRMEMRKSDTRGGCGFILAQIPIFDEQRKISVGNETEYLKRLCSAVAWYYQALTQNNPIHYFANKSIYFK